MIDKPIGFWGRLALLLVPVASAIGGGLGGYSGGFPGDNVPPGPHGALLGALLGFSASLLVVPFGALAWTLSSIAVDWLKAGLEVDRQREIDEAAVRQLVERQAGQLSEAKSRGELSLPLPTGGTGVVRPEPPPVRIIVEGDKP